MTARSNEDSRGASPLLPAGFKLAGWPLAALGAGLALARFGFGLKPAALDVRVFALHASFLDTKRLTTIDHNAADEIAALLLLAGLFLVAFSRERREDTSLDALRLRALRGAVATNLVLLLLSVLFVYGIGFVYVLAANMVSTVVLYLMAFRWLVWRQRRRNESPPPNEPGISMSPPAR